MIPFSLQTRVDSMARLGDMSFDLIVIGGGINGAGILRDAALRGMNVLLLEKGDVGSGTSSKSSKLIHGGLRYLKEYDFGLTRESCVERNLLIRQNPHLVTPIPFVYPIYEKDKEGPAMIRAGMWLYEALGGFKNYRRHQMLTAEETLEKIPDLNPEGLKGSAFYYDAAVDDARLTLENVKAGVWQGGIALTYAAVIGFLYDECRVSGVTIRDMLTWKTYEARATTVVNATGVWVNTVRGMDSPTEEPLSPTKGIHLVIPSHRIRQSATLAFRAHQDDRQLFATPWNGVTLLGTTDTFFRGDPGEAQTGWEDVEYLLEATNRVFPGCALVKEDIIAVFAGIRPLIADRTEESAGAISREHHIFDDDSGLLSLAGGKLTTYRLMAKEVVDMVLERLPARRRKQLSPCTTEQPIARSVVEVGEEVEKLVAESVTEATARHLVASYGPDALRVLELCDEIDGGRDPLQPGEPYLRGQVVHAVRHECAIHLTDLLTRRLRLALWCPGQGLEAADVTSRLMAQELGWSEDVRLEEIARYNKEISLYYRPVHDFS